MSESGERAALLEDPPGSDGSDDELPQHRLGATKPKASRDSFFKSPFSFSRTRASGSSSLSYLKRNPVAAGLMAVLTLLLGGLLFSLFGPVAISHPTPSCATVHQGYYCYQPFSQLWGQYSPFFSLAHQSTISPDIPPGCNVTFVQVLSRHGARYPTVHKSEAYSELIKRIQSTAQAYLGNATFLKDFSYVWKSEDLTTFGEDQLVNSGINFYERYMSLVQSSRPFIRASGSPRVVVSANKFIEGFNRANQRNPNQKPFKPLKLDVIIGEGEGMNNTLDHGNCDEFERTKKTHYDKLEFFSQFEGPILDRMHIELPGVDLTSYDLKSLMDMCSFHTVALTPDASRLSPFCGLFSEDEWAHYDYLQTLGQYYVYGPGNPLGPVQGVGFVNELVSRLTSTPVVDHTTVNHTLDDNLATFPLDQHMYADFSHDNTMTAVFSALGLFNYTRLSNTTVLPPTQTDGFAASWTVPFASRAYVEKMQCHSIPSEPLVRILLNDRVYPLRGCPVDTLGRCKLNDFIKGLSFATSGGNWAQCFP
ncbi:hypothetical protein FQN57_007031 [Myotisia sp. PD_48]|nr:hypothetical protein FQN57_007031 [Myotisia sp. PD_48]